MTIFIFSLYVYDVHSNVFNKQSFVSMICLCFLENKWFSTRNSVLINIWLIFAEPVDGTTQFKNTTKPAIAFEAAMQVCDSRWTWGHRFPVAAQGREWRAAGFKPWVSGASEVTSQLCPRRDDGDGFTGVFSWSTEPYSKDSNLEPAERGSTPLIFSSQNSKIAAVWTGSRMPPDTQNSAATSRWHCQTSFHSFAPRIICSTH